ncbi:MAG: Rpn family recombination-promoting nuclease/putative transposase, partial [Sphaerospermopsis sp. SIO1G2]|nr:Rpn family recombination-promoting nuclease/putative transposase [Sphaerospermopsis sp. SIO1G2]
SFLNAMLYKGEPVIQQAEILNPYLPRQVSSLKDSYVDVQAVLDDGSLVLIEMQTSHTPAFFKRVLYNTAKRYSEHLPQGEPYTQLIPVISLIVADFVYRERPTRPLSAFKLQEIEAHFPYPAADDFQIVIAELPKFTKEADDIDSLADEWLFFMQNAKTLREVPPTMQKTREIEAAFEIARRINFEALELLEIDRRERDQATAQLQLELSFSEGVNIGREEGREEGIGIGREEGRRRTRQMVLQMLGLGLPLEQIAQIAEMTVAEIQQIEREQGLPNSRTEP